MGKVKQLTLDRYGHGLAVRVLDEEWKKMRTESKPTGNIENLLLKVIDAPGKRNGG